jgi:hypothetical protein
MKPTVPLFLHFLNKNKFILIKCKILHFAVMQHINTAVLLIIAFKKLQERLNRIHNILRKDQALQEQKQ